MCIGVNLPQSIKCFALGTISLFIGSYYFHSKNFSQTPHQKSNQILLQNTKSSSYFYFTQYFPTLTKKSKNPSPSKTPNPPPPPLYPSPLHHHHHHIIPHLSTTTNKNHPLITSLSLFACFLLLLPLSISTIIHHHHFNPIFFKKTNILNDIK